ncbi:Uncharacterised protein [Mycobacteroides abscessus subsp. abscessus]|nr:Uncharacterised protein [Mycobacteroides abscessus subsp. abscessus]
MTKTRPPKSRYASHSALIDQAGPFQLDRSKYGRNHSCTMNSWRT